MIYISESNSHLASAQMVISKQAEWASIDATTLLSSKKLMQDGGKDLVVLKSIGPLPPYPIVVNKRLSGMSTIHNMDRCRKCDL